MVTMDIVLVTMRWKLFLKAYPPYKILYPSDLKV